MIKPQYRLSISNWLNRKYCSANCRCEHSASAINNVPKKKGRDNWKYNPSRHICSVCGIERKEWHRSNICKSCLTKTFRGENHPNYKDGSSKNKREYSYYYKLWRMDIFQRDWFTCQFPGCGYKGKDIQAHHIQRVKEKPELLLDKNNGITLCKSCHNKTRHKEKYFEKLFNEIIKIWE